MDDATQQPCRFYFVHLNPTTHEPLLGTMFSKNNNKLDTHNNACTEGRLPATQFVVPAGHKQCFPASGLRFWYQVDNITKRVVPNSLISRKGKPEMCKGTSNYLEYIIYT